MKIFSDKNLNIQERLVLFAVVLLGILLVRYLFTLLLDIDFPIIAAVGGAIGVLLFSKITPKKS